MFAQRNKLNHSKVDFNSGAFNIQLLTCYNQDKTIECCDNGTMVLIVSRHIL